MAREYYLNVEECNINSENNKGASPLHTACHNGKLNAVKLLVESGAKVNKQDFNGFSPLHEAVFSKTCSNNPKDKTSLEICQFLLNNGGDPAIKDKEGNYPFHIACLRGLLKCAKLLFHATKQPGLVNISNRYMRTPLMMSVESNDLEVVELLLSLGGNANVADKTNTTALQMAALTANFGIFEAILKATSSECIWKYCVFLDERDYHKALRGNGINSVICNALTVGSFHTFSGYLEFLIKVLESGLDPRALQCPQVSARVKPDVLFLETPISFLLNRINILEERTLDFLQVLIDHQSPVRAESTNPQIKYINPISAALNSLIICPESTVLGCLQLLLQNGADPEKPMKQAVKYGCVKAVVLLLQYSNVLEPDNILDWIKYNIVEPNCNREEIVKCLLPLAPFYKPTEALLPDESRQKLSLTPRVYSLANYCRAVVRRQVHSETRSIPSLFRLKLSFLPIPRDLHTFLGYRSGVHF